MFLVFGVADEKLAIGFAIIYYMYSLHEDIVSYTC